MRGHQGVDTNDIFKTMKEASDKNGGQIFIDKLLPLSVRFIVLALWS